MCKCTSRTLQEITDLAIKYTKVTGEETAVHKTFNKYDFCQVNFAKMKGYKIILVVDKNLMIFKY